MIVFHDKGTVLLSSADRVSICVLWDKLMTTVSLDGDDILDDSHFKSMRFRLLNQETRRTKCFEIQIPRR